MKKVLLILKVLLLKLIYLIVYIHLKIQKKKNYYMNNFSDLNPKISFIKNYPNKNKFPVKIHKGLLENRINNNINNNIIHLIKNNNTTLNNNNTLITNNNTTLNNNNTLIKNNNSS